MKGLIPWGRGNAPQRYEETSPFFALHRQMNELFDDFFRTGHVGAAWPNVEVRETDKDYQVQAELPGMDEKDIDLTLREGILTLKGEKKSETREKSGGTHYTERWFGSFERSFDLGADVDPDKVHAVFNKGVLTVTVGKRPDAPSRVKRIEVARH